ncbi:unnamed protein product, partial [Prunus brigantina]
MVVWIICGLEDLNWLIFRFTTRCGLLCKSFRKLKFRCKYLPFLVFKPKPPFTFHLHQHTNTTLLIFFRKNILIYH